MKLLKNDIVNEIKLLIELSCESLEKEALFEQFHQMLIEIYYAATDVFIEYGQKRVYMNIEAEDSKGDFLERLDNLMPTKICLKLTYDTLEDFLKNSMKDKNTISKHSYSLLKSKFFKGKFPFKNLRPLEEV